ncbi:MAG: holo-ACP synthase [Chitinivibrionia bacterium]|nr:holo-ACP synthase [Chitinivibrionia bacterium]
MIIGVGVDICDVNRIAKIAEKPHWKNFQKKVFSDGEIEYCLKMKNSAPHFAVRWAVKEAFYKALPDNLQQISSWKSIEYINNGEKKPSVRVLDEKLAVALKVGKISKIHCSVSHEKEICAAQIILENCGGQE